MGKKNVIILIVSFVALALAGLGLYAWRSAPNAPVLVQLKPRPIIPVQTQIPADWKTYRNETMKFEIKYPPDWKVDEIENQLNRKKETIMIYTGEKIATIPGSPISPYTKTIGISILERGKTCGDCNIYLPKELQETKINGYRAVGTIYNTYSNSMFWVYSTNKDHVILIGFGNPLIKTGERDKQTERLFKMILSTFRFLQ